MQRLVDLYNNAVHSTIRIKLIEVNERNEKQILRNIYPNTVEICKDKFKVGDKVHVSKYKKIFDKSYHPN